MILYTQTICPKCMLVKNIIDMEGKSELVEIINLDDYPEEREKLKLKGFSALPILFANDEYYLNQNDIIAVINA